MKRSIFKPSGVLALEASSWGESFILCEPGDDFETRESVAIVAISGPLVRCDNWMWDSYESISSRVFSALTSQCTSVVLKLDSPGGEVGGCFELVDSIREMAAKSGKRLVAYVDGQASSAAYALACSAAEIYLPPSGSVGSIGCVKMVVDQTAMDRSMGLAFAVVTSGARKADGNPHVAISEQTIAAVQTEIDEMAALFFERVASARGLSREAVKAYEAAQFTGASAIKSKLADGVKTFEQVLAMLGSPLAQQGTEIVKMDEREKAIAALKAMAAGDDKDQADMAKKALTAMGEGEEPKAEDDAEEPKDEKPKEEPAAADDSEEPKAFGSQATVMALANTVQQLSAKLKAREDAEERSTLLASRPDLASDVVTLLKSAPLSTVRTAVKTLAKGAGPARGQVTAAIAAVATTGTAGKSQETGGSRLPPDEKLALDRLMGLAPEGAAVRMEGNRFVIDAMTATEARKALAAKGNVK